MKLIVECNDGKLLRALERQIKVALTQYEITAKSGSDKRSAQVASQNTRITQ